MKATSEEALCDWSRSVLLPTDLSTSNRNKPEIAFLNGNRNGRLETAPMATHETSLPKSISLKLVGSRTHQKNKKKSFCYYFRVLNCCCRYRRGFFFSSFKSTGGSEVVLTLTQHLSTMQWHTARLVQYPVAVVPWQLMTEQSVNAESINEAGGNTSLSLPN